jgi:hypothetical protein
LLKAQPRKLCQWRPRLIEEAPFVANAKETLTKTAESGPIRGLDLK